MASRKNAAPNVRYVLTDIRDAMPEGVFVAPEHSVLLFITVPGGILVVSSAAGLAIELSGSLTKSIKRLFK